MRTHRRPHLAALALLVWASAGCDASEAPPPQAPSPAAEAEATPPTLATRRTLEGCDPNAAAQAYRDWVGRDAVVKLLWNDLPADAANLEIPMGIVGIVESGVAVQVGRIPMQEYYLNLWTQSGHLRFVGDRLVLDPCSAELRRD